MAISCCVFRAYYRVGFFHRQICMIFQHLWMSRWSVILQFLSCRSSPMDFRLQFWKGKACLFCVAIRNSTSLSKIPTRFQRLISSVLVCLAMLSRQLRRVIHDAMQMLNFTKYLQQDLMSSSTALPSPQFQSSRVFSSNKVKRLLLSYSLVFLMADWRTLVMPHSLRYVWHYFMLRTVSHSFRAYYSLNFSSFSSTNSSICARLWGGTGNLSVTQISRSARNLLQKVTRSCSAGTSCLSTRARICFWERGEMGLSSRSLIFYRTQLPRLIYSNYQQFINGNRQ